MKYIASVDNKIILKAASLKEKKYREKYGLYLTEGKRAVFDALAAGALIDCVFVKEDDKAVLSAIDGDFDVYGVSDKIMNKICGTVTPQSIAALVKIVRFQPESLSTNAVVLDGISDPGNLGTIIRTAAACNYKDIFLCGCTDPYNPKCIRAAMGGINFVKLYEDFPENVIKYVKGQGLKLMCADMGGTNLFDCELNKGKYAFVIGNEARGVSDIFLSAADIIVSLPMKNIESLNAAVSASVIMYCLKHWEQK
jgi:TrmH family RNA methyltransferase